MVPLLTANTTCYIIAYDDPKDLEYGVKHGWWAPRTENKCPLEMGDVIFFYRNGCIRAAGLVTELFSSHHPCPTRAVQTHLEGRQWEPIQFGFEPIGTTPISLDELARAACEAGPTHTPSTNAQLDPSHYAQSVAGCFMWRRPFPCSDKVASIISRMATTANTARF